MKRLQLLLVFLMVASANAQTKTIDLPPFGFANTRTLEIRKVTLSEKETVLEVEAFYTPGYWIRIASDTYLKAENQKYKIRSGDGIVLDSLFWMPKSGRASFKLVFDPIPPKTEVFDFIESDCEGCFKIYDIHLSKKQRNKLTLPKEFTKKHEKTTHFSAKWQKGNALVSGKIIGYRPDFGEVSVIYLNPITGNHDPNPVTISPEGSFTINTTIYSPTALMLRLHSFHIPLIVAPNKALKVLINLPEISRKLSRFHGEKSSKEEEVYFAGFLADINTEMYEIKDSQNRGYQDVDIVAHQGAEALEKYIKQQYNKQVSKNNSLKISDLSKKILNMMAVIHFVDKMDMIDDYLAEAYAEKHNISEREALMKFRSEPKRADFYNFYKEIPYNDPDILLSPVVGNLVNELLRLEGNKGAFSVINFLLESPKVNENDKAFFKAYLEAQQKGNNFPEMEKLEEAGMKYSDLIQEEFSKRTNINMLSKIWGVEQALLLDLIKARGFGENFAQYMPLTDADRQEIKSLPAEIQQVLIEENDKLLARIEANKTKTGFTVLDTPQTADEQLLVEILKPFKGKVILMDMWATWCGPCLAANKQMEPLKAEFTDKDVVFLYLSGENSPKQTWENMIPNIKGQHYRLTKQQWSYLEKSLNARGVPTYVIIDKNGEHSYKTSGFPGLSTMRNELLKALQK